MVCFIALVWPGPLWPGTGARLPVRGELAAANRGWPAPVPGGRLPHAQDRARRAVKHPAPPLPVLEIGDSLGIDLSWGLGPLLAGTAHPLVSVALGDTGLAEPSYYDWPAHLDDDLAQWKPGLVVVFLGANDVQNFYEQGRLELFGSPGWMADYGGRVAQVLAEARQAHARLLWVGMPPMASPTFSADMVTLNRIYRSQTSRAPGSAFFSSFGVLGGRGGSYLQGPPGLGWPGWRAPDGVHITVVGAQRLAGAIVAYLRAKNWL
ncbi:MAG TPA: GDSL-type esterase/lipase family protein [Acidimicrobiales bacterium]|nr:GDSL-type esterase/lipase family protein [Acidimicrobiales bacterium]